MLRFKMLETLTPVYRARKQWSDRSKQVDMPLFPGYIFCRFAGAQKARVLDTPGIGKIVGFGGHPAPVPDDEVGAIQAAMRSGSPLRPWPRLKPGDRVRVERGPLRGVDGTFVKEKDAWTFVIGIEMLQRWVAVDLDPATLTPLRALAN